MLTLVVAAAWSGEGSDAADSPFASDEFHPKIENMQVNAGGTGNARPATHSPCDLFLKCGDAAAAGETRGREEPMGQI